MYKVQIFDNSGEKVFDERFDNLLIRESRGMTVETDQGQVVNRFINGRHSCELKLWSKMSDPADNVNEQIVLK